MVTPVKTVWTRKIDWAKAETYAIVREPHTREPREFQKALSLVKQLKVGECVLLPCSTGLVDKLRARSGFGLSRETVCRQPCRMLIWRDK